MQVSRNIIRYWPGLLAFALYSAVAAVRGPIMSSDSVRYQEWAQRLVASHFAYWQWATGSFSSPPLAYVGWVTSVAGADRLFGNSWPWALVGLNVLVMIGATSLLLQLVHRTTSGVLARMAALAWLILAFDLWSWIPYVLTDSLFAGLAFLAFYLVQTGRSRWALLVGVVSLAFRPDGVALCAFVAVSSLPRRPAVLAACFAVVPLAALLMYEPGLWPLPALHDIVTAASDSYRAGYVVMGRPETSVAPPNEYLHYLLLSLRRVAYYFVYWAPGFSSRHLALNLVFYSTLYVGAIAAAIRKFRMAYPGLLFAIVFALFHGLQQLDFDWRYRLPCLLPLIYVAVIGLSGSSARQQKAPAGELLAANAHDGRIRRQGKSSCVSQLVG